MTSSDWLTVHRGDAPLLISIPHAGIWIPEALCPLFVSAWQAQRDADWWIDVLYDFVRPLGATIVSTSVSRSVIDVNRDPSGASLYPGMATTGLCPVTDFDGDRLYREHCEPDAAQIADRRERYYLPYHDALRTELDRLRQQHGNVVLYDCHSIRSRIPRLFDGVLPDMNIGTNGGLSCSPLLAQLVQNHCSTSRFSHVLDGRFKGGWITRHYGNPQQGIHAVQMELACATYMDEPTGSVLPGNWPTPWVPDRAAAMRQVLENLMRDAVAWARC